MAEKSQTQTVKFLYKTSPEYSIKHVDGATASMMPTGNIHVSFFLERSPYLEELVHEISPDGGLGPEVSRKLEFEAICRDQQMGIVLTAETAENIIKLLQGTVKQAKDIHAHAKTAKEKR